MQIKNMLYPHRIPFLGYGECDICQKPGKKKYSLPYSKYLGLISCNNKDCNNLLKLNIQNTTKTLDELNEIYKEFVKVKRSDNKIDTGWVIITYAYQEKKNGEFWVYVSKDDKIKCVTLNNLNKWNV